MGDRVPGYERNLILVHTRGLQSRLDFETIRTRLATRAPDIEVFVVDNGIPNSVTLRQAASRPTLVFSPVALGQFKPVRGKIYAGRPNSLKMDEIRQLVAGGVPVPESVMVEPDTRLDPQAWGPFTVLKPNSGRQGAGVRLYRTRDVRWVDPRSWPGDDPRHGRRMVAQRFIDTGPHATNFRTLTVFGRPVYATQNRRPEPRPFDLDPDGAEPIDHPIAATGAGREITPNNSRDVLDLAVKVGRAFPEVPVLGIDIIRDVTTGRLYALEVNARGMTWHLSSDYWADNRRRLGFNLYDQFGALDVISDALIDVTRREAA